MQPVKTVLEMLHGDGFLKAMSALYPEGQLNAQKKRYIDAVNSFATLYGADREITFISAPGRTEIGGNHTDHQNGRVLAASVNLDVICVVSKNGDNTVRVKSEGYPQDIVALHDLEKKDAETDKAISLIRGILSRFKQLGYTIGGFDAYTTSNVLKGSGLSSSAAFEVAVGTVLSRIFNGGKADAATIAKIGQYAENVYFGKPCGLMDQMASSVGGFVTIDFKDPENPEVKAVRFDFAKSGHTLCIVDTKGSHSDLTPEYSAIPAEMKSVAGFFGKDKLREVDEVAFYDKLPELRKALGDRPVLRAMHFFGDNERVLSEVKALGDGDFEKFKRLVVESGRSSFEILQNVFAVKEPNEQGLSVALALSEMLLSQKGAWRVHGGGFAGTIQALVPNEMLEHYRALMEKVFGTGSCYELSIRPLGGVEVDKSLAQEGQ